jgi:phosphatidylglycerophosphatase A
LIITRRRDGISPWHPAHLIATWFGCGLLPKAPGTWGSAAALPFAWGLYLLGGAWALLAASGLCFLAGWWASSVYVRKTGIADPSEVVIDEVAGQWLVLAAVPADPVLYALGFLVFRVLDIAKPWPASWADRHIEGGLGVMADDMLAAAYGALLMAMAALLWSLPWRI